MTQVTLGSGVVDSAGSLALRTNGTTTAVTIDTSQNVGFGAASPSANTRIYGYKTGNISCLLETPTGSASATYTAKSATGGSVDFGSDAYGGYIQTQSALPLLFYTNATEKMRIDSSGNLLVGTTSVQAGGHGINTYCATSGVNTNISVVGDTSGTAYHWSFYRGTSAGTETGSIRSSGSTTSYVTSSDYRLKENISPMTGALAVVANLKPCTYTWKIDGAEGQGFIAHELQAVVPDAVSGEKDAVNEDGSIKPQGIDTSFLVATLTAAIQEQQAIIESLTTRIELLEAN